MYYVILNQFLKTASGWADDELWFETKEEALKAIWNLINDNVSYQDTVYCSAEIIEVKTRHPVYINLKLHVD